MQYYFYDLETSGLNPKWQRIMQFAGQRTDADFNPIGEPDNWLVKLTPEVLPDPEAVMITGITPQETLADGYSEPEFLELLNNKVFTYGTTVLGFNSIRFDDEFMRYTLYRNFYDPYEREWSDQRSRWDIIDLVRMTRALRPDGIQWPTTPEGDPTNRLELITKENGLSHEKAHDALSDVLATIDVAKLIREKQPKLYEHIHSVRGKKDVKRFFDQTGSKPFVHTSSMLGSANLGTSAMSVLGPHPTNPNAVLAFDLRYSPVNFKDLNLEELTKRAFTNYKTLQAEGLERLPVKAIHINKSPAIAPLGVLDQASQERIKLTLPQIQQHYNELLAIKGFSKLIVQVWEAHSFEPETDSDAMLYDGFLNDSDRKLLQQVRNKDVDKLADWHPNFADDRMNELLLRYKAKHFPKALSPEEKQTWDQYRLTRISGSGGKGGVEAYMNRLAKLASETKDEKKLFLLEELRLYAESIAPYENEELFDEEFS